MNWEENKELIKNIVHSHWTQHKGENIESPVIINMMEDLFSYYATRVKDFRDARELNKQMLRDMNRNIKNILKSSRQNVNKQNRKIKIHNGNSDSVYQKYSDKGDAQMNYEYEGLSSNSGFNSLNSYDYNANNAFIQSISQEPFTREDIVEQRKSEISSEFERRRDEMNAILNPDRPTIDVEDFKDNVKETPIPTNTNKSEKNENFVNEKTIEERIQELMKSRAHDLAQIQKPPEPPKQTKNDDTSTQLPSITDEKKHKEKKVRFDDIENKYDTINKQIEQKVKQPILPTLNLSSQETQTEGILPNLHKQQEPKYFVEHLKLTSVDLIDDKKNCVCLSFAPSKLKDINIKNIFLHEHNIDNDHLNGSKVKLGFCQIMLLDKSVSNMENSNVQMFKVALRKKGDYYKIKINKKISISGIHKEPEIYVSLFTLEDDDKSIIIRQPEHFMNGFNFMEYYS